MLYKWRTSYSLKAKKWREYHALARTMPVVKLARTHYFFKTESLIRKYNLHKVDVIKMRTGRGYNCSCIWAVSVIKHRKRNETKVGLT
jgi:hypothetical protein